MAETSEADLDPRLLEIAALGTGLRADQVALAVTAYREAAEATVEPQWTALMHVSGAGTGLHSYVAEGTEIHLVIETAGNKRYRSYQIARRCFETFAEARAFELGQSVKFRAYTVNSGTQPAQAQEPSHD